MDMAVIYSSMASEKKITPGEGTQCFLPRFHIHHNITIPTQNKKPAKPIYVDP
jgi:hypothetical protein